MKASFTLGLFATQMVSAAVSGYNDTQAQIALDLDIVAYCGHDAYKSHVFSGVTEGFIHTKTLYDVKWDVEGYIGYLPSDSAIYVVFRGTDSLRNLIMDGDATSSDYEVVPECAGCKVHTGFY